MTPDIITRLSQPVTLDDIKPLLKDARDEIIELRMLLSEHVCTFCGQAGHKPDECRWKLHTKSQPT